jgi:hypothetical protein
MSRRAKTDRQPRGWRRLGQTVWHNAPFALLGVAVLAFVVAVIVTFGPVSPTRPSATQPNAWIALPDQAATTIITAARQSPLFTVDRAGDGDFLHDLSHLGTPQLVTGYAPAALPDVVLSDYYVIPILDANGDSVGAAVLLLNADRSALQVQSIDTYAQPRPHGAIAQVTLPDAMALFHAQAHHSSSTSVAPRLVYFNFDFQSAANGSLNWQGGGAFPDDPVWLVADPNGQHYVVGTDLHLYLPKQLPAAQS